MASSTSSSSSGILTPVSVISNTALDVLLLNQEGEEEDRTSNTTPTATSIKPSKLEGSLLKPQDSLTPVISGAIIIGLLVATGIFFIVLSRNHEIVETRQLIESLAYPANTTQVYQQLQKLEQCVKLRNQGPNAALRAQGHAVAHARILAVGQVFAGASLVRLVWSVLQARQKFRGENNGVWIKVKAVGKVIIRFIEVEAFLAAADVWRNSQAYDLSNAGPVMTLSWELSEFNATALAN